MYIGVMMRHEPPAAVHPLRRAPSADPHLPYQLKQRHMAFRQIAALRNPVIHLQIDIDGILRIPRRKKALIPNALQRGRQPSGPAAGNHQISPVIEQKLMQPQVFRFFRNAFKPLVRGQPVMLPAALQPKVNTGIIPSIIFPMPLKQLFISTLSRCLQLSCDLLPKDIHGIRLPRFLIFASGFSAKIKRQLLRLPDAQSLSDHLHRTALCLRQ